MDSIPSDTRSDTISELTDYNAYLLRMWRDGPQRPWRASMHCVSTGTLHYFADISHLVSFLQDQTDDMSKLSIDEPEHSK